MTTATAEKGGAPLGWLLPVLALTAVAMAGGVLVAGQIVTTVKATLAIQSGAKAGPTDTLKPSQTGVKELPPMVTNLAAPNGAVIRLQAAIVYNKADTTQLDVMAVRIADDSMAFLKTLTLAQLQGAEGLQHLREDLGERASMRSEGRVHDVLIEMLVVE